MHVLLVQPPLTMSSEVHPPLGLCMLASHVARAGHTVRILDLDLEEKCAARERSYLDRFDDALRRERPDVAGFTSMFNNSLHAERLIAAAKRYDDGLVTVAGGSHFGAMPLRALERIPALDFVVRGEGEAAFADLLGALARGEPMHDVAGLALRSDGAVRENPPGALIDLKQIGPVWSSLGEAIDLARYPATIPPDAVRRSIYIEAGRGCPFSCSFCATAPFWQRRYRVRTTASIVAEMRELYETYGYETFMLVHDLLTADRRFMADFCNAIFEANLPVEWTANHRADIELGPIAATMRTAGCVSVFMGIESASERVQADVHKGLTREEITSTVRTLRDVGITSTCSFIIGFPAESTQELSATLRLAGELKMLGAEPVQVHRLRMWPPAPLAALGLPASFDLDALRLEYPSEHVTPGDVATIEADSTFFTGYFTTESTAGSAFQLAQAELFFAHALAVVPLTTAVLGACHGDRFASAYYGVLAALGPIAREDLDSSLHVLAVLAPVLDELAASDELAGWERRLAGGVLDYERLRIRFVEKDEIAPAEVAARGPSWMLFRTEVDVVAVLAGFPAGAELTPALLRDGWIAFTRSAGGSVRGFAVAEAAARRIAAGDARAMAAFDEDPAAAGPFATAR